jgi:hypothetical protein
MSTIELGPTGSRPLFGRSVYVLFLRAGVVLARERAQDDASWPPRRQSQSRK